MCVVGVEGKAEKWDGKELMTTRIISKFTGLRFCGGSRIFIIVLFL